MNYACSICRKANRGTIVVTDCSDADSFSIFCILCNEDRKEAEKEEGEK